MIYRNQILISSRFLEDFYQVYDIENSQIGLKGEFTTEKESFPKSSLSWFSFSFYEEIVIIELTMIIICVIFGPALFFLIFYRWHKKNLAKQEQANQEKIDYMLSKKALE